MEYGFDPFHEMPGHHRLGDSVGHRGQTQDPYAASRRRLGDFHRTHRRVPENILFQIWYKLFFRSFSNSSMGWPPMPGAPLFAFTPSCGIEAFISHTAPNPARFPTRQPHLLRFVAN